MKKLTQPQLNHNDQLPGSIILRDAEGNEIPLTGDGVSAFLGDPSEDDDDVTGDLFLGDPDDDEIIGDQLADSFLGDIDDEAATPIDQIEGDMFVGRGKKFGKTRLGSFLKKTTPVGIVATKAAQAAKKLRAKGMNKSAARLEKRMQLGLNQRQAMAMVPGQALSAAQVSPVIANNLLLNQTPTRAKIPGQALVDTIVRSLTQYPGRTRTITQPAAAGTVTFTFAAPSGTEGGDITRVPMVLLQFTTQRQFSIANAQINVRFTTALTEDGNPVDYRAFSLILPAGLDSGFVVLVPFREVSSTAYPAIVTASGVSNLVIEIAGVPTNTNIRAILPGPDSAQYETLLKGFGIPMAGRGLIRNF